MPSRPVPRILDVVPRSARRRGRRGGAQIAAISAAALGVAVATGLGLPRPTFTATAVVGVEGGPAALRPAMVQAAIDAAVSRKVVSRAAAVLANAGPSPAATAQGRPAGTVSAHLLDTVGSAIEARRGGVPGTLLIRAADVDAERAASMASAVASALVGDLDDREQAARRQGDAADALRLANLQEAAAAAHRRLAALGGASDDLAAARTTANGRLELLRTRLDAIRAILAAGDPPLGAGRDVPPGIDALQTTYLDLTRQLAKARATLGDRHTTVLGLSESLRRTSTDLTAAWRRLEKVTDEELAEAKTRVEDLGNGDAADASKAASIEVARIAARTADEALAGAQTASSGDEALPRWRLIAPAPVPALAAGLELPLRLALATGMGLVVLALGLARLRRRPSEPVDASDAASRAVGRGPASAQEPVFFEDAGDVLADMPRTEPTLTPPAAEPAVAAATVADAPACAPETASRDARHESASSIDVAAVGSDANRELVAAMAPVLPAIRVAAEGADIPVVLVAANEAGVETLDAVLALGEAAACAGQRVLLVEGGRARPALAAAADLEAEPALASIFGETRVVLRADGGSGLVYLAPAFLDGARLAADLARTGNTLVADALADEFDLVVLDGGRASGAAEMAGNANAVLRVGRFASTRDDERCLASLGKSRESFLGTIAAGAFAPPPETPKAPVPIEPAAAAPRLKKPLAQAPLAAGRRLASIDTRRRVGLR